MKDHKAGPQGSVPQYVKYLSSQASLLSKGWSRGRGEAAEVNKQKSQVSAKVCRLKL